VELGLQRVQLVIGRVEDGRGIVPMVPVASWLRGKNVPLNITD